ncbi:DUF3189 family protein [Bacillota bacterium LX-D]|nr:DUF3189 family protein [Bacillota bacterium LX-D]
MKIIYYCQTGKYGALAAAGLHLQIIDSKISYKGFRKYIKEYNIKPYLTYYFGIDGDGNEIYALEAKIEKKLVHKILYSFQDTFCSNKDIKSIDAFPKNYFLLFVLSKIFSLPILNCFNFIFNTSIIWMNLSFIKKQVLKP